MVGELNIFYPNLSHELPEAYSMDPYSQKTLSFTFSKRWTCYDLTANSRRYPGGTITESQERKVALEVGLIDFHYL